VAGDQKPAKNALRKNLAHHGFKGNIEVRREKGEVGSGGPTLPMAESVIPAKAGIQRSNKNLEHESRKPAHAQGTQADG